MTRPILYRAFVNGVMYYGVETIYDGGYLTDANGNPLDYYEMTARGRSRARSFGELIKEGHPIMQFTGLHDKNGKEIWEGDIVRVRLGPPEDISRQEVFDAEIVFEQAAFFVNSQKFETKKSSTFRFLFLNRVLHDEYHKKSPPYPPFHKSGEVLGNIYESSHLLGDKNVS